MASKVPVMPGADVVALLEKHGFRVDRIRGSHHIMVHDDGRGTTVPVHNRDVAKGTMAGILDDVGLTSEELRNPKLVKKRARELTPTEVTQGVASAAGAVKDQSGHGRSGARRGATSASRNRDERSRRR